MARKHTLGDVDNVTALLEPLTIKAKHSPDLDIHMHPLLTKPRHARDCDPRVPDSSEDEDSSYGESELDKGDPAELSSSESESALILTKDFHSSAETL